MPTLVRSDAIVPAILWPLSFACSLGAIVFPPLAILAGVLFGLGFVAAGFDLWFSAPDRTWGRE